MKSELLAVFQYHPLFCFCIIRNTPITKGWYMQYICVPVIFYSKDLKIIPASLLCLMKSYTFISSQLDPVRRRSNAECYALKGKTKQNWGCLRQWCFLISTSLSVLVYGNMPRSDIKEIHLTKKKNLLN